MNIFGECGYIENLRILEIGSITQSDFLEY